MNLQENIQRIKTIMEVDNTSKMNSILFPFFDKVFDRYDTTKDKDEYVRWYDENLTDRNDDNISLHKTRWGGLYVGDCDVVNELKSYQTYLSINDEEFKNILKDYMNNKFQSIFIDRPIEVIHFDYCSDDYFN